MANVEILLVGGPDDGNSVVVELDPSGRPPLTVHQQGDGLADATVYEIETTVEPEGWIYRWRGPVP
ncbi:hypothetical protein [Melissospora conviva]|uniref:hypothetical protein n=1 Tax=Melissospora conviva TaxID=3388432 RepID=UPI003B7BB11C